ncbi:MAG: restriction endonuclease [Planctomycetota bacterium]
MPDFQTIMLPLLEFLSDGKERRMKEVTEAMSERFGLTDEERQEMLPSGYARTIVNRVAWAKSYLKEAGLVKPIRRGVVQITSEGRKVLAEKPDRIDMKYLERFPSYIEFRDRGKGKKKDHGTETVIIESTKTPEEVIEESHNEIRQALVDEVLQTVKESTDAFFERLVVKLLVAMGYGGSIEDAGKAVGKSGDGGIDGVIKEDKLGLDLVVIQAKRWIANHVGRPDVQSFAGSMEGYGANKGVFITTSEFSKQAVEFVEHIQRKIVLIDGVTLAGLMVDHDIGVTPYRTFTLKQLDSDFFEE